MPSPDGDQMTTKIREALTAATEQLDADTRRRLTQARYAALDALPTHRGLHWRQSLRAIAATIALAVLAATLWQMQPTSTPPPEQLADLDLLVTPDSPDFFGDLEFYQWLAEEDNTG